MIVYVVNSEYAYGTYRGSLCIGVYDSKEKAQKVMKDQIENTNNRWTNFGKANDTEVIITDDMSVISLEDKCETIKIIEKKVY